MLTRIADPLATVRGDKHYVAGVHFLERQVADLHAPCEDLKGFAPTNYFTLPQ